MTLLVKICGLKTHEALEAAIAAGAEMAGFVFFLRSPRNISLETARQLGAQARGRISKVALVVDADDVMIAAIVEALRPDMLQLHGNEPPERVAAIRARFGLPVMKAFGIATREDLAAALAQGEAADRLLFDAKPPRDAAHPGGNGHAFDWPVLSRLESPRPWMLSGGLNADNVAAAIAATGARAVDVSSGVESAPGVKDLARIAAFVANARAAPP